jgi:hypothetical protein
MMTDKQYALADLSPDRFMFRFDILPSIHFRLTAAPIPGLATTPPIMGIGARQRFRPNAQGVDFSGVNLTFIVDENLDNWLEAMAWIDRHTKLDDLNEEGIFGLGSLVVLDSDFKPVLECQFQDCSPTALSDIELNVTDDSPFVTATLTIDFSTYKLKGKNFETNWL